MATILRAWFGAALGMMLMIPCGSAGESGAGELVARDSPEEAVDHWSFRSAGMERSYDISVGLPTAYDSDSDTRWPAIIVLDGNRVFPIALGISRGLIQGGYVEDLFVISIGTPFEEGLAAWGRRRVHEFSPDNQWPMTDPFGKVVKQSCKNLFKVSIEECVGGAPDFLRFITDELLPELSTKYRIDGDRLGLFGVSAGGFFSSWTLFQEQSPFRYYLISSPAMAYGDGEIMRLEARWAEKHDDLAANVYMSAGMLETNDPYMEGSGKIVSGMAELSGMLATRNYPSLRVTTEMHPGMGHGDAAAATLAIGMRQLFGKAPPAN
jgi:predicted alpha/beta superfamily hydrolase